MTDLGGERRRPSVRLIGVHLRKHAAQSGYDRLADYLPAGRYVQPPRRRLAGGSSLGASARVLRACSGLLWYSVDELVVEARTVGLRTFARDAVDHYLYGERQLWLSLRAPRRSSHRIVATFHQPADWLRAAVRRPERLSRLDGIIVVSEYQAAFYAQLAGSDRVFVVPHGVDVEYFRPAYGPADGRGNPRICLTVSEWLRDFDTLERVVSLLWQAHGNDIRFVVVSRSPQAHRLQKVPGVRILTDIGDAELLGWYQRADILLLPLLDSTANNVVVESLACGTPVVATAVGGVPEYVDEQCARLTTSGDAEAMARAVTDLVFDADGLAAASRAARRRSLDYDWKTVAEATWRVYENVLQR